MGRNWHELDAYKDKEKDPKKTGQPPLKLRLFIYNFEYYMNLLNNCPRLCAPFYKLKHPKHPRHWAPVQSKKSYCKKGSRPENN